MVARYGLAIVALAVILSPSPPVASRPPGSAPEGDADAWASYQFVLLRRGPHQEPMGEREIQAHQERHLAFLERLHQRGKLIGEGPLDRGGDLRGAMILDLSGPEEVESVLREDSWVRLGRITPEVHPMWTVPGDLARADDLRRNERCYLGLLWRPENAPDYDEERLREIQAGHLDNIRKMKESGDLLLAAPMGDDGRLRGILVFRTLDPERIKRLVAEDVAVKTGRLGVELYPWHVTRGTLPAR